MTDLQTFESHRPTLLALGYRMLGDLAQAEDVVQEAWLRWQRRDAEVEAPRAYLSTVVVHLCLNELSSARARREQCRADRLPEPVDLRASPLGRVEATEQLSMAVLVLLQRLTPAERAALLLAEVFEFSHREVAAVLGKSEAASRQHLKRARERVAAEKRISPVSSEEHRRLLAAFLTAAGAGRTEDLVALLAEDAELIVDAGPNGGTFGRVRNLSAPVVGGRKVAAFVAAATPQGAAGSGVRQCELNGQPAILVLRDDRPYAAILIAVANGRIRQLFIHADPCRLGGVPGAGA